MVYNKLFADDRTKMDVDFYNYAKDLQVKPKLPDGCSADDFMNKAVAWIYKIRPYLAQPFSDKDTAKYISVSGMLEWSGVPCATYDTVCKHMSLVPVCLASCVRVCVWFQSAWLHVCARVCV